MNGLKVGYVRVSTLDQKTDRQLVGLEGHGLDRLYSDKVSGSVAFSDRPSGRRLLRDVEGGKVSEVHFWSVDRIGRDIKDITNVLHDLMSRGIQVIIHKEGLKLLTSDGRQNPTATLVLSVMSAIAQIERNAIRERTAEGLAVARAKGRLIGRKKGTTETVEKFLAKPKSVMIKKYLESGHTILETSKLVQCSTTTCVKVKRLLAA
jgi:DNA invertase Pin-like site-specific DNA recombinase